MNGGRTCWMIAWLINGSIDRVIDWLNELRIDWMLIGWSHDWIIARILVQVIYVHTLFHFALTYSSPYSTWSFDGQHVLFKATARVSVGPTAIQNPWRDQKELMDMARELAAGALAGARGVVEYPAQAWDEMK